MAKMILRKMNENVKKATKASQGGEILEYNPQTGVLYTGFDDLTSKDLDIVSNISKIDDPDNKRSYYRKKKSSKSPKRKPSKKCKCK